MSPPRPLADIVLHELPDGEHALSDTGRGRMLIVNDTGAAIWLLLDGVRDEGDIAHLLAADVDVDAGTIERDVAAFVTELREQGFLS